MTNNTLLSMPSHPGKDYILHERRVNFSTNDVGAKIDSDEVDEIFPAIWCFIFYRSCFASILLSKKNIDFCRRQCARKGNLMLAR